MRRESLSLDIVLVSIKGIDVTPLGDSMRALDGRISHAV